MGVGPLAGQGQHPLCRVDPGQEPGWLCWAGTSQPAWADADTVQAFGGLELRWLGSGPALGQERQGETEAGVGVMKGDTRRNPEREPEQSCGTREERHGVKP